MPAPFDCGQQSVALTLTPIVFHPETRRPPRKTARQGRSPNECEDGSGEHNSFFGSKVLSGQHAEVWEQNRKVIPYLLLLFSFRCARITNFAFQIYIKDVKSYNGTFINGERLIHEDLESESFELKSNDIVVSRFHRFRRHSQSTNHKFNQEFGINIVGEENRTIIHHKDTAHVLRVLNEQTLRPPSKQSRNSPRIHPVIPSQITVKT